MNVEALAGFQASVDARDSSSVLRVEAALKAAKDSLLGEDKILFLKCAGGTCPKPLSELLADWGFEHIAMIPASKTLCFAKARAVAAGEVSTIRMRRGASIRENLVTMDSLLRRNTSYLRLRNVMLDISGRRPASLQNRKLRKLLGEPEQFLVDASSPILSSVGLNLYRQIAKFAGQRTKDVTPFDLPQRTLLVCIGADSELNMEALAASAQDFTLQTELVVVIAAAQASSIPSLLAALQCPRVRVYAMNDSGAEQMLRYGLARSYAMDVAVVASPVMCDSDDIERVLSMVTHENDHAFDSKSGIIAARRTAWRDVLLKRRHDPMFQVGLNTVLGKLGSLLSGSLGTTWSTEQLAGFRYSTGIDPSHPFDSLSDTPVVTCFERKPVDAITSDTTLVSVIMTVHNAADTVSAAIDSVLAQTYKSLELIVIDDCSSDDSLQVLQEKAACDERVRVLQTGRNSGTYYAKNVGLRFARGTFATFHDSDDVSSPHRIEQQANALSSDPDAIGNYTCYQRLSKTGQEVWLGGSSNRAGYITLMVRREAAMKAVGYFDSVRVSADAEYVDRLRIRTGLHVRLLPIVSYYALQSEDSLTTAGVAAFSMDADERQTMLPPVRREYREAARNWHEKIYEGTSSSFMPFPLSNRPFPAPDAILPSDS